MSRASLADRMQGRPVRLALVFEGGLAVIALVLALVFGLRPWSDVAFTGASLWQTAAATGGLIMALLVLMQLRWGWVVELERIVREFLLPLFRNAGPVAVGAVSLMAGIGEELLFRGVVQAGLQGPIGPTAALITASLLFGLAHAVNLGYFAVTFVIGLYLGWIYQATGNLLVPIMVHFLYDWIVLSWYLHTERVRGRA